MSSRPPNGQYHAFAITAPGLESIAFDELETLGAADARITDGGVSFSATRRSLYEANLELRTVSRVVVRAAEFSARAFHELERRARKVPWEAFISPNLAVSLRVTCRKSRLYHSDAVAERVAGAIASRVSGVHLLGVEDEVNQRGQSHLKPRATRVSNDSDPFDPPSPDSDGEPNQLVLVRLFHDRCTISVDSSGELLHVRGYRQAVGKAPIRETLAAAALLAGGWRGQAPLLDPMCGAGTVPIEGAMIARRIAPGLHRHFAFESWPDFDADVWRTVVSRAESKILDRSPVLIQGSDRDAGAVESAKANAERAGVALDVELTQRAVSAIQPPGEPGWIVSNPPYGLRVGDADRLRDLYAQIGNTARAKCPGWRVVLVSADMSLERQLRLGAKPLLKTTNGGIGVRLIAAQVPSRPDRPPPAGQTTDVSAAQRYPS